jgi:beta-glucosidase-like glycosyl hydrolase
MQKILSYRQAKGLLSTKEKVGQLFMPAAFINDSEAEIARLEQLIGRHQIGGLCFFHSRASAATNYEGKKKVVYNEKSFEALRGLINRYQKAATYPLLIAIDAEWGLAMRVENTPQYPYAIALGAMQDGDGLIFEMGRNIARDCLAAGIHWNLAPVVDINANPNNPVIGYRSFGDDKTKVTRKALAYIKGMEHEGLLTSIKHFPGHGDTATDSHLGLPLIDKTKEVLEQNELFPFQELVNHGVDSVMVGHLSVPSLAGGNTVPSSISKEIIKGILRGEMGFKGVVISDALNMHAVSKNYPKKGELEWLAFDAGNDVLCFAEHTGEAIETILQRASEQQVEESFRRVWMLKEKAMKAAASEKMVPYQRSLSDPAVLNKKMARMSLTLAKGDEDTIASFRREGFIKQSIPQTSVNPFFTAIDHEPQQETNLESYQNILLALFPRQVKPANDFGYSKKELQSINGLLQNKQVILYLFGNPYVLGLLDISKARAVVVVHQDFEIFQKEAAAHFLGTFKASGQLPITLVKP